MEENPGKSRADGKPAGTILLTSPIRTAAVAVVSILLAEVVAMAILRFVKPLPFWPATLTDATVLAVIVVPALWLLVFRPVTRLAEMRRRIVREMERRKREIEALYAVTAAGTRQLDLDRLLPEVVDVVAQLFDADGGWAVVLSRDPSREPLVVGARGVPAPLLAPETTRLFADCPDCPGCVPFSGPPAEAQLVAECLRLPASAFEAAGFRKHLAMLLSDRDESRVFVNLVWRTPREHDASERSLLRAIAAQVGIAVRNAALYQAEQRAREAADTMASASLAMTRSLDLDAVLASLLDHLGRLVPFDRAKVMLLEGESRLKVRAIFTPSGKLDFGDRSFDSFDIAANGAVHEVLSTRRGIFIGDTRSHPEWGRRMKSGFERSWLGVPLLSGGKAIGLYTLVKAEPGFFTREHIRLAEALSAPASVAVSNARLFEALGTSRKRLQDLSRQLVEFQENELRRIARELHDESGQLLSSLKVGLHLLQNEAGRPEAVFSRAEDLKRLADHVQEGLHGLASDLRPATLDHLGLLPALDELAATLSESGRPTVHLETTALTGTRLAPDLETTLYRIAQEALRNVVRHSRARQVSLVLEKRGDHILMIVEDDGRGFDVEAASRTGRLGLLGIRERAEMFGGTLLVESSPGSGTTLVVEIPHVA